MLGDVDAELDDHGLRAIRGNARRAPTPHTKVVVVDRNVIGAEIIAWRLGDPDRRVIWVKRGGASAQQALRQAGFVAFADMVVVPGDVGAARDAADELASKRGKLREIGVCQAYQVMPPYAGEHEAVVFLSLGAFEPAMRDVYHRIQRALDRVGLPYVWCGYSSEPLSCGFDADARVPIHASLERKARCAALVSEGGYNSVHEALHLGRPALLIPNEGNNREQQGKRVAAAKRASHLIFDASLPGDLNAWIAEAQRRLTDKEMDKRRHGISTGCNQGLKEMADLVEAVLAHTRRCASAA